MRIVFAASVVVMLAACGGKGGGNSTCPEATEGCACVSDRCGFSSRGEQLVCMANVCEAMKCPAGALGCVCRNGNQCDGAGNGCSGGFCVASSCVPGQLNCACLAGGCDPGFFCLGGSVCVDSKGFEGGACYDDGTCTRGNRCDSATGLCAFCEPGSAGCACNSNNACNAGLACNRGVCLGAFQLPPASPRCYTPCSADLETDAGRRTCGPDHLMDGCLPEQTCSNGSCLETGQMKATCAADLDCPFFQACLTGGCYSNCDVNADCTTGQSCFSHVCRTPCTVSASTACPTGTACQSDDGQNGFCTPVGHALGTTTPVPNGGFELPTVQLDLSNVRPSGTFTVIPKTNASQDITVRKLWHSTTSAAGVTERVDAPLDANGAYRACDPVKNECPMAWLSMTPPGGTATQNPTIGFRLLPGCYDATYPETDAGPGAQACPVVNIGNGGNTTAIKWEGELEISAKDASARVHLTYVQRPDGQWQGSMYYFGTFSNEGLQTWIDATNKSNVSGVQNALLQRWMALRLNAGAINGWEEFNAVLTATREGSWSFGNVKQRCRDIGNGLQAVCYPYLGTTAGVSTYVSNADIAPVPTGVSELPIAMNLQLKAGQPDLFEGRVVTSTAMHYPGNPGVKMQFVADPAQASSCTGGTGGCIVYLKDINTVAADVNRVTSQLGGRYPSPNRTCDPGYAAVEVPWLVSGFTDGTVTATSGGGLSKIECRDAELPFDKNAGAMNEALNASLAGGNPVPDGQPRQRTLRFLDGALINQSQIFVLFEERYNSFMPMRAGSETRAYGYMLLKRVPADLKGDDFIGLKGPTMTVKSVPTATGASCDPQLMNDLFSSMPTNEQLVTKLLDGTAATASYIDVGTTGIHYYCEDTGLFNGGPGDDGLSAFPVKIACPAGSKVTYFSVCVDTTGCRKTVSDVARDTCQTRYVPEPEGRTCTQARDCRSGICSAGTCVRATCGDTMRQWKLNGTITEGGSDDEQLTQACTAPNATYCDDDRNDLRVGKKFWRKGASVQAKTFGALLPLIESAFRYKTRFKSTVSGSSLGFAPQQCVRNSDAIPYCYDPQQIEEARKRIDCLLTVYKDTTFLNSLFTNNLPLFQRFDGFLKGSFSHQGQNREGFERLYAELLIMQGDDALTAAYASRFDLAAAGGASFRGSKFEPNGIDLTGVAGSEMANLYVAVQYYQLALDRLYMLGPDMQISLDRASVGQDKNFIKPEMVTDYLERLVRAASQKSRAWGEIARRYQNFNRPDLSRRVIERAYVQTYLESALISRLMLDITAQSASPNLAQLRVTLTQTQRNYRLALIDMRDVYAQITDEMNYFGYAADYIPFPALDFASTSAMGSAYDVISLLAKQRTDLAKQRELIALTFGKQGKVDAAQFQSDLTSIRNNYENQLSNLCGTFVGDDGRVYPAIRKYAPLARTPTAYGDPCGRLGNGDLHAAMANAQDAALKLKGAIVHHTNLLRDIDIERGRAAEQCHLIEALANFQFKRAGVVTDMQNDMAQQRAIVGLITGSLNAASQGLQAASGGSPAAGILGGSVAALAGAAVGTTFASDLIIAGKERDLADFNADTVRLTTLGQCDVTQVDSRAVIAKLFNNTLETQIEVLRAEYAMRLSLSEIVKLANNAQRLQGQQEEAEQLLINIASAQNDPNVRIYQNDSVINADVSFNAALAAAFRLTRVYEYYTSQSYAKKEQLFVIRMVTAGQYNLENYLLELDNEFQAFEEQFGNPDIRVLSLSLRDDILKIPYLKTDKTPLSENERIAMMRERLRDARLLDANGYLTLPFSTNLKQLSPLTRNHKVRHVEVDLQGVKMGDPVARVYLRMSGTGVVRNVSDEIDYYVFPSRLGVINASLLGAKVYDLEVYRNSRFRDRPLVNTMWELIINQRDELANQDIDLQTLTDARVLIYYSDFTAF